jgi:hypothetical protein
MQFQLTNSMASEEGLIANGTSIHAGLRTRLLGRSFSDYDHDEQMGFVYIEADGALLLNRRLLKISIPWELKGL